MAIRKKQILKKPPVIEKTRERFNNKQLQAIAMLSEIPPKLTTNEAIRKKIGVSTETFYKWLRDDSFNEAVEKSSQKSFKRYAYMVRKAHIQSILQMKHPNYVKLFYQYALGWSEKTMQDINLKGDHTISIAWLGDLSKEERKTLEAEKVEELKEETQE